MKETTRKSGCRWKDNTKMDLQELGWVGRVWNGLIWLRIGRGGGHL
jgi:hypothetical protein